MMNSFLIFPMCSTYNYLRINKNNYLPLKVCLFLLHYPSEKSWRKFEIKEGKLVWVSWNFNVEFFYKFRFNNLLSNFLASYKNFLLNSPNCLPLFLPNDSIAPFEYMLKSITRKIWLNINAFYNCKFPFNWRHKYARFWLNMALYKCCPQIYTAELLIE